MSEATAKPDEIARLQQIDAEERRRLAEREVEQSEFVTMIEDAVEALPDALIVANEAGDIILANKQAELMFGYHRLDLIGKTIEMLLPSELRAVHMTHRADYFHQPTVRTMGARKHLLGRRRDGSEIHVEIMLAPLVTRRGIYALAVVRRGHREPSP